MIELDYIRQLLPLLHENNCSTFKMQGLEVSLIPSQSNHKEIEAPALAKQIEQTIPPDLRADDLFNHDKVLHWSGSGDLEPMPLTGEEPA